MSRDRDAELRESFRALRTHDEGAVPEFDLAPSRESVAAARVMRRPARRLAWAAGVFALAASVVGWLALPAADIDVAAVDLPRWPTATDPLLVAAADPLRQDAWDRLPTHALGRHSFTRYREDR